MQQPRRIVIVGGGTAGWMAAAAFGRFLTPHYEVTLVESDAIGTVGVGEATIPQIQLFNNALGINEPDFIKATAGSFKLGIVFDGWWRPGHRYIHAFGTVGRGQGLIGFHHYWLRYRRNGGAHDFWRCSANAQAAFANRFGLGVPDAGVAIPYAFHFDASLYAAYLRRYAEARGVQRIEGRIDAVSRHGETGDILNLSLEGGRTVAGDLFVDCSGFRSLLLGEALGVGFDDWSNWLPCDRALAVPCASAEPFTPYTKASVRPAGWQWRIPLQHRTGNGYVYCSALVSDDEAAHTLLANLDGAPLAEPRLLRFTAGKRREVWRGNCVALGLAGGFLEPLESTSIHLIQTGIARLLQYLPGAGFGQADIASFNAQADFEYTAIRDFLILHYAATERDDTEFWRARRAMAIPDSLRARIDLFAADGRFVRNGEELFAEPGWLQVMLGQGILPRGYHPLADSLSLLQLDELMGQAQRQTDAALARFMDHGAFIQRHCAMPNTESAA